MFIRYCAWSVLGKGFIFVCLVVKEKHLGNILKGGMIKHELLDEYWLVFQAEPAPVLENQKLFFYKEQWA